MTSLSDFDQEILKRDSSQYDLDRPENFHASSYQSNKVGIIEESQITRDVKVLEFDDLPPPQQTGALQLRRNEQVKRGERVPRPLTPLKQRPNVPQRVSPVSRNNK
jgi:hypothetical protein